MSMNDFMTLLALRVESAEVGGEKQPTIRDATQADIDALMGR